MKTIEEKAKAYDEALERARKIKNGEDNWRYSDLAEITPALTEVFPELRESEDERIRKGLIEALTMSESIGELKFRFPEPTRQECIAYLERQKELPTDYFSTNHIKTFPDGKTVRYTIGYLEKQKEQKPTSFNEPYNPDEYEVVMEGNATSLKRKEQKPVMSREKILHQLFQNGSITLSDYLYLTEEQKPAEPSDEELVRHPPIAYTYPSDASKDEQLKMALLALLNSDLIKVAGNKFAKQDLIDWVEKQKPAWSEEDENKLEQCIRIVTGWEADYDVVKSPYSNFLKSLRPQPKAEWSEEDEQLLSEVYFAIDHSMYSEDERRAMKKYIDSLRPSWKPSKEQMGALLKAESSLRANNYKENAKILAEFYEELKKL